MSCALASPENGVCANRRPVRGRRVQAPVPPVQPSLVPLAVGHALEPAAVAPFSATAPESTFSLAQVRAVEPEPPAQDVASTPAPEVAARVRSVPPSFKEIRAGRAAAASRTPVAQVRIPVAELDGSVMCLDPAEPPQVQVQPLGMEALVERVRQRTAARLSRAALSSSR